MVVRGDLALGEPAFVSGEDGRDKVPAGADDVGVASDGVRAVEGSSPQMRASQPPNGTPPEIPLSRRGPTPDAMLQCR
jgi:hypothetical protein